MEARLIPLNAFIALAAPAVTSWPNTLHVLGYQLEALEVPATTDAGRVVIDCVAFHADENRFLLAEGKSGGNIEPDQARRYSEVDPRSLVTLIGVTVSTPGELTSEAIYLCLEEFADRIVLGLSQAGCDYPVIAVGERQLTLHGSGKLDSPLVRAFSTPVSVPGPPPAIILVDELSADVEYDDLVSAALVAAVAKGEEMISCTDLTARAIPYLHLFGARHRNDFVKAVAAAAERLSAAAPETFEFRAPTQSRDYAVVRVQDSPEQSDPRGRTQRYQSIKSRMTGASGEPVGEVQGSLFDDVDLAEELEKADTEVSDPETTNEEDA